MVRVHRCGVDRMSDSLEHKQMKDEIYDFLYNLGCSYIGKEDCGEPRVYYYLPHWHYGSKRHIAIADVYAIWHGFKIWVELGDIITPEKLEALRQWEKEFRNIFVWIPYGKSVRDAMRKLSKSLKNIPKFLYREIPPPKLNIEFVDLSELTVKRIEELTEEYDVHILDGIVRISKIDDRALETFNRMKKEKEKKYGYPISRSITYWKNGRGLLIKPHELPYVLKDSRKKCTHSRISGEFTETFKRQQEWYEQEIARRKEIERHAREVPVTKLEK